jgi:hypothetical protein
VGLEKFRDPEVLAACNGLVTDMATREAAGFDMLYINMPWKSISMDYAAKRLGRQPVVQANPSYPGYDALASTIRRCNTEAGCKHADV